MNPFERIRLDGAITDLRHWQANLAWARESPEWHGLAHIKVCEKNVVRALDRLWGAQERAIELSKGYDQGDERP